VFAPGSRLCDMMRSVLGISPGPRLKTKGLWMRYERDTKVLGFILIVVVALLVWWSFTGRAKAEPMLEAAADSRTVTEWIGIDRSSLWDKSIQDGPLVERFAVGIIRSRVLKGTDSKVYWETCGKKIPDEQIVPRAYEWAEEIIKILDNVKEDTGVAINPWGAFATIANESGFNECALNYASRLWASRHMGRELITETWKGKTITRKVSKKVVKKFRQSYDRDTVWRILHHEDYAKGKVLVKNKRKGTERWVHTHNKFDGGPMQMRFSVKRLTRDKFDELTSFPSGITLGFQEMARRALGSKRQQRKKTIHPRPWQLWPGTKATVERIRRYDRKITKVARWLGARRDEI